MLQIDEDNPWFSLEVQSPCWWIRVRFQGLRPSFNELNFEGRKRKIWILIYLRTPEWGRWYWYSSVAFKIANRELKIQWSIFRSSGCFARGFWHFQKAQWICLSGINESISELYKIHFSELAIQAKLIREVLLLSGKTSLNGQHRLAQSISS